MILFHVVAVTERFGHDLEVKFTILRTCSIIEDDTSGHYNLNCVIVVNTSEIRALFPFIWCRICEFFVFNKECGDLDTIWT